MRTAFSLICVLGLSSPLAAQDHGLTAPADALAGPRLQARFELEQPLLRLRMTQPLSASIGPALQTLRLLGDYQFSTLRLGDTGGLRVTGGVLLNLRQPGTLGGHAEAGAALPLSGAGYAGVGYASASTHADGGWGVSADLGVTALGFGHARLDRSGAGSLVLDAASRDIRLQPMIRLGVNMAF
ncbi:hypothetical protein [Aquabacterium sp. OR-4]|uniref:hypothetical protein n=1 Tax=Aquabacterium sp. OR-4 TaxID=2978127 RepID=UPI0021B26765|nr:hypothetical protein [Aquabacterium sp. OR-4]MDT7837512.1 hypothetical protein [Aquabacterium sp. OR-4]